MKGGYVGKVLHVDLTNGTIQENPSPSDDVLLQYVGCWGLALRYLYDMLPPGYMASDPENPLIFFTGPLTGVKLPGATNMTLGTKNFDTGLTIARSHTHGAFGCMLKSCGYDGMIITGRAEKPVYLWIQDGKAAIRDAAFLWGKDTHETEECLKKELKQPKASVAAIGPAGENLCAGGMICNDRNHSFSHGGVGSSMGAKNLKAIAIYGTGTVPVADEKTLQRLNQSWIKALKRPGHFGMHLGRAKTKKSEYRYMLDMIGFAGKNFQTNQLTEFGLGWSRQKFTIKGCKGCPIACPYDLEVTEGPYKGYVATVCGGGEALEGSGAILNILEPGSIYYLTDQFDRLGIECSVAGCTIAMAIEAFEKGLITTDDTQGLTLKWGDVKTAETLLQKMVHREGIGEFLARGIREAAHWVGGDAPNFAVHLKGTGMSLHDWRAVWGTLLGQIVGSGSGWPAAGADCFTPEPDAGYPDLTARFDRGGKPLEVRNTGIVKSLDDSTGLCWFVTWGMEGVLKLTAETLTAVTGMDYSVEDLLQTGERIMNLERAFNVRHGLMPSDDWEIPERLAQAPMDGRAAGKPIGPYLRGMVEQYYRLMGWDPRTGKPWKRTLERLGLQRVSTDLWG